MQKLSKMRKNKILFFLVAMHLFLIIYCGCFWGREFRNITCRNLILRLYNNVIELYMPQIAESDEYCKGNLWTEVCRVLWPSADYGNQLCFQTWQEDEQNEFEQMALEENERLEKMISENAGTQSVDVVVSIEDGKESVVSESGENGQIVNETRNVVEQKVVTINRKKLEDFDYLRQNFYQVDNTTTIGKDQLNVHKLLDVDMSIDISEDGPDILIYHTHSQECYCDSKEGDEKKSVMALGDKLAGLLEEQGFKVLHHKGKYDVGDRDHAYSNAAPALEKILKDYPSIQVVIDLHRDGVAETTHLVTDLNGKKTAQIMFFNGLSRTTTQGNLVGLKNPYIAENLALSFQLELAAKEYYPDFTRRTYLKGYRYNMHMCSKSILVEVGAQTNTYKEAENAMEPLADILCKVLKKS